MSRTNNIRVALDTLGCKVNQAETEQLARQFVEAGYNLVSPDDVADIYILNTCTVTHIADRKSRHWLRMVHRRNPNAILVATGCYAERAAKELSQIDGVSLVVSNTDKTHLVALLAESAFVKRLLSLRGVLPPKPDDEAISTVPDAVSASLYQSKNIPKPKNIISVVAEPEPTTQTPFPPPLDSGLRRNDIGALPELGATFRTRAFIKVQDGCHNFCSYCIVPLVRQREESVPVEHVIAGVRQRVAEGYKEIVITGVEVGSYNYDGVDLKGLLERILTETDVTRLRLSSLQPPEVTPELIRLWRNSRLCRHFHLSVQSGSDTVLQRMNRRYTTAEYAKAVSLIRAEIPGAAITTDIIVGFPGETDEEFAEGYQFCKKMEFARIHVFPYSPRRGTKAARLPNPVSDKLKKQRTDKMLALADECIRNFSREFLGKTMPVLFEQKDNGLWSGLTDNYIRVYVESGENLTNQIVNVKLVELQGEGTRGELIDE